jgi:ABC-type sugar transport system permease subunit
MIDEQFEIEEIDLDDEDFWQSLVNLFIWVIVVKVINVVEVKNVWR